MQLHRRDWFSVITFSDDNTHWPAGRYMVAATSANVRQALAFVSKIEVGGGTSLGDAALAGLAMARALPTPPGTRGLAADQYVRMEILLTDGVPSGLMSTTEIL